MKSNAGLSRRGAANLRKQLRDTTYSGFPALPTAKPKPATPVANSNSVSYRDAAAGRGLEMAARDVSKYSQMLLNPFEKNSGCRYPDETIVATGLVHLARTVTYVQPALTPLGGQPTDRFITALGSKVISSGASVPPGASETPFTILAPGSFANGAAPSAAGQTDYLTPQATFSALNAVDRTLAAGVRVSLTGLPTSTFMPSGTLYFVQAQEYEFSSLLATLQNESGAVQAVTAGKGFSTTLNELNQVGSIILPLLPQGPMSFTFTDNNSYLAFGAGQVGGTISGALSSVVSAAPRLIVVGYGLAAGVELRFEYSHHVEYIPTTSAAGLIQTAVEPPSTNARQGIARAAQIVQESIAGRSTARDVAPVLGGGAVANVVGNLGKMAVGMIPGGSLIAQGAKAVANAFGAPKWLSSILSTVAS